MFNGGNFLRFCTLLLITGVALTLPSAFTDRMLIHSAVYFSVTILSSLVYFSLVREPIDAILMILSGLLGTMALILSGYDSVSLTSLWYYGWLLFGISYSCSSIFGLLNTRGVQPRSDTSNSQPQNAPVGSYPYVRMMAIDLGFFAVSFSSSYNIYCLWYLRYVNDRYLRGFGLGMVSLEGVACIVCVIHQSVVAWRLRTSTVEIAPMTQP
ncbi:hypothetical protein RND81_07G177100 [Saponaria officinalis]|uniref:NADH dehydrogenase subunit 6 n=1 Tax=Saponaria officinalis TaxID=3572 RepID=A0AAW1JS41_SAPOF